MSFRSRLLILLTISVVVVASIAARAQAPAEPSAGATVHGAIVDPENALIPNATVTLTPLSGNTQTATSKGDGTYSLRVLAGTYVETVVAPGFGVFVKEGIKVTNGANLTLDAKLAIEAQKQQVTVDVDPIQLSTAPESNASSTVITGDALNALSDDPDDLQNELLALAGPAAGPNGGQIYIDGFTGGVLPPKSSILAIRINQNPFSAQYDQLGYGRIEIITRPGADKFHGNFGFQFGDKFLNTSSPFLGSANTEPDYHSLFFQGSVTGPIRHGMSFSLPVTRRDINNNTLVNPTAFYASSPTSTTLCDPGTATLATCTSYAFPANARALGNPQTRFEVGPRVDMALGPKNTLTLRFQYETGTSDINVPSSSAILLTGANTNNSETAIQISDTQLLSSRVINSTRFEFQRMTSDSNPLSTSPFISVQGAFTAGGSAAGASRTIEHRIELQNYLSMQLAKNYVRLGGRLRTAGQSLYSTGGTNGQFTYSYLLDPCSDPGISSKPSNCLPGLPNTATPCATANVIAGSPLYSSYQCGNPSQYALTTIHNATIHARETDVGLYAEDDWNLRPNLTISYGVRLETENVIHSNHDFAPRVSVAYGIPRKSGKTTTVIRGGFGIFYNRFSLGNMANQIENNGQNQTDALYESPGTAAAPCAPATPANCLTGTGATGTTTVQLLDPHLRSAYIIQSAVSIEQQLSKYVSVAVTYLNARGEHQFMTRDLPNGGTFNFVNESEGVFRQNQINTNINIRTPKGMSVFGYYVANWANSNVSNITDPYNPRTDYGRATFGVRNRLSLGGNFPLPYHITASPLLFANSGTPYNVTTGIDENLDSQYNDRPTFLPGTSSAVCSNASTFAKNPPVAPSNIGGETYQQIPVNYCTGPANMTFNMRLFRTFGIGPKTEAAIAASAGAAAGGSGAFGSGQGGRDGGGGGRDGGGGGGGGGRDGGGGGGGGNSSGRKYSLTIGAQVQNLFNQIPYGTPTAQLTSAKFGVPTTLQGGVFSSSTAVRRIQLQASFNF